MIDLKGELANSKAGQAAIKQAIDTAAKESAASAAREKSLKVLCAVVGQYALVHPCHELLLQQIECIIATGSQHKMLHQCSPL